MKFKVKVGLHIGHDGKTHNAGDIITTDCDLIRSFGPEKFELVEEDPATSEDDVTDTFNPLASTKGARVLKISGGYTVVDSETGDDWTVGEKLTSQAKVKAFLDDLTDAE